MKTWQRRVEFSTIKHILIKPLYFTEVIKKIEIGFSSLYQKGLSKIYTIEKVRSLGMGEGIPLKNDRNRWERGALIVRIIAMEKNNKKFFFNYLFSFKI